MGGTEARKSFVGAKNVFLCGQLQEGLKNELRKSPCVLGAVNYKELSMAAKKRNGSNLY